MWDLIIKSSYDVNERNGKGRSPSPCERSGGAYLRTSEGRVVRPSARCRQATRDRRAAATVPAPPQSSVQELTVLIRQSWCT